MSLRVLSLLLLLAIAATTTTTSAIVCLEGRSTGTYSAPFDTLECDDLTCVPVAGGLATSMSNCNVHGTCSVAVCPHSGNQPACNPTAQFCSVCDPYWIGPTCSFHCTACDDAVNNPGAIGCTCTTPNYHTNGLTDGAFNCASYACTCADGFKHIGSDFTRQVCTYCQEGFAGPECSQQTCQPPAPGSPACNGGGTCVQTGCSSVPIFQNGSPTGGQQIVCTGEMCQCFPGFTGPTCGIDCNCVEGGTTACNCTDPRITGGPIVNNVVTFVCGNVPNNPTLATQCVCTPGHSGQYCFGFTQANGQCDGNTAVIATLSGSYCTCPVTMAGLMCAGVGTCTTDSGMCNCTGGGIDTSINPNAPLYAGRGCCANAYTSASRVARAVCGGRGTCNSGDCVCNSGFGGLYCCPQLDRQFKACGSNGVCGVDGVCVCDFGFNGAFCEINVQCNTGGGNAECSGRGTCVTTDINYFLNLQPSPLNYIYTGHDGNVATARFTIFMARFDAGFNGTASPNCPYYGQPGGIGLCVNIDWAPGTALATTIAINNMAANLNASGMIVPPSKISAYVVNAMNVFHPSVPIFDQAYISSVIASFRTYQLSSIARGITAILAYEAQVNYHSSVAAATYPVFGALGCVCANGAGGRECEANCNCAGFILGERLGACDPVEVICQCGKGWVGTFCNETIIGFCMPDNKANTQVCSSHGVCQPVSPYCMLDYRGNCLGIYVLFPFNCSCIEGWTGQYCDVSLCGPDEHGHICHNLGACNANGKCVCDIALQLATSNLQGTPPLLPIGGNCTENGISQCGTFSLNPPSSFIGTWRECSGRGVCMSRSNQSLTPICVCQSGYSGPTCNSTLCSTQCNSNQFCDFNTGLCTCYPVFVTPSSCGVGNLTCKCSQPLCGNGVPDNSISSCVCNARWTTDTFGFCTVALCPLVVDTIQGRRVCRDGLDFPCIAGQTSLANSCCYNACKGRCTNVNATTQSCACDPVVAFIQSGGICFPKCHGQNNFFLANGGSVLSRCDCTTQLAIVTSAQFVDSFCTIFTCLNGGRAVNSACSCPPPYSGQFCGTTSCTDKGVFNSTTGLCDCLPPFAHTLSSPTTCLGDTCSPGFLSGSRCICTSDSLLAIDSFSCIPLNCNEFRWMSLCSQCILLGGTPGVFNSNFTCSFTHVSSSSTAVALPSSTSVLLLPSTATASSSSSSSTGVHSSSSATIVHSSSAIVHITPSSTATIDQSVMIIVPPPLVAHSSTATTTTLSIGAIAGIVVGGVAGLGLAIGIGIYAAGKATTVAAATTTTTLAATGGDLFL